MQNALQFLAVLFSDCRLSFRCFHCIASLSVVCGCGRKPARGTMNFRKDIVSSGNRCKFTSMFRLHLAGTSCASIAGCRMKFQVPLTAFLMHPHISEPCRYAVKHWKDRLNLTKGKIRAAITAFWFHKNSFRFCVFMHIE